MKTYPLKFEPVLKERIWGSRKLEQIFNKKLPPQTKIGESWELADLPNGQSIISNGQFKGETLNWITNTYPEQIIGSENFSGQFPLLIKFLDANDTLSIQVHPDQQACQRLNEGQPKTECWYIISAQPDAVIYKGLKHSTTKQMLESAIKNKTVDQLLNKISVKTGQCHFLPAGTPHAIGKGLLIAEIQTPSDTTYRLFDWNRTDDSGKPRQLHIRQALESINFNQTPDNLTFTEVGRLVDCQYFKIHKGHQLNGCQALLSKGKMKVILCISGHGKISDEKLRVDFSAGDCLLIPSDYEGVMYSEDDTQFLTITLN
ncbi:MAG: class I mannose-6-phosphate isomerase [Phycisphaerae bacterium]|nr:class I mannose-6-phosphate isomerase [Phycisphaerae bacterium]